MKLHQWLEKKLPAIPETVSTAKGDVPVEKGEIFGKGSRCT